MDCFYLVGFYQTTFEKEPRTDSEVHNASHLNVPNDLNI